MDIIKEIFWKKELTISLGNSSSRGAAILCKYVPINHPPIEIPLRISNYLINEEVLTLDSGNFETGEKHYIYNIDRKKDLSIHDEIYKLLIPILREVRLSKLIK